MKQETFFGVRKDSEKHLYVRRGDNNEVLITKTVNGGYIDNPEITVEELMEFVKAPDFPTGGYIYGVSGVREAYLTGRGRVVMRADRKSVV